MPFETRRIPKHLIIETRSTPRGFKKRKTPHALMLIIALISLFFISFNATAEPVGSSALQIGAVSIWTASLAMLIFVLALRFRDNK
jgi:hypothetical protein